MPDVRTADPVIAIACADLHLSLTPPPARAGEPSWFDAMARPLQEVKDLADKYKCPVLCAGDIFDRWNSPAELINFAIDKLPHRMIATPGQHDLPLHAIEDIRKSSYWTLVGAGVIIDLYPTDPYHSGGGLNPDIFRVYRFPWGATIAPPRVSFSGVGFSGTNIALTHQYAWIPGHAYPDAPDAAKVTIARAKREWAGYTTVIFGDNHKGWYARLDMVDQSQYIFNCGGLMRRKSDELNYKPQVGLIHQSGRVTPYLLDISKDVFEPVEQDKPAQANPELAAFLDDLVSLENAALDFREAVRRTLDKQKPPAMVRQILLEAMETDP